VKNKLTDLRNHLFETIERLKDEEKPMEVARALAVSNVAQTIIDSAKVELKALELAGSGHASEFLEISEDESTRLLPNSKRPQRGLSTGKDLGAPPS
jgi:hypothetical protein